MAFDGDGDNPCTGDNTDCIERCYQQCTTWNEDGTFTSKGFILKATNNYDGRCYCEAADSSTCTRGGVGGDYFRYDYYTPTVHPDEILLTIPDQAQTYDNPMVEVSTGAPTLTVSQSECQSYMDSQGVSGTVNSISWAGGVDYPEGCSVTTDGGTFYFNTRGDGNIGICGFSNMHCIQKSYPESSLSCRAYSLQHNYLFWDLVANYAYTEVSSGSPAVEGDALYVTESECEEYAGTIGATWGTIDNSVYPHGCISMSNNRVQWVSSGGGDCNVKTYTGNCIQKAGIHNMLCHLGNTLQ